MSDDSATPALSPPLDDAALKALFEAMNEPRQGNLEGPLIILGGNGVQYLVVHEDDVDNPVADAQLFDADGGVLLDQIKPLAVWLKWLYYMEGFDKPIPYTPDATARLVETYKAAKRARAAAEAEELEEESEE